MPVAEKYDDETQVRAVRMYVDCLAVGGVSQLQARREVGELLGVAPSRLRNWIRRVLVAESLSLDGESLE